MELTILIVLFALDLIFTVIDSFRRSREHHKIFKYLKKLTTTNPKETCNVDLLALVRAVKEMDETMKSSKSKEQ